jgi:hypothetical protein
MTQLGLWILARTGGTIGVMKQHDFNKHPGPMRVMSVDAETAGFIVAIGIVALAVVSIPEAKWFLLGALFLGLGVALFLRYIRKG